MSALVNGFKIINAVILSGNNGLSFARIVEASGVPKASAHRLLSELVGLAVLTIDSQTRHYHGGLLLAQIGASVTANYDLRSATRPLLQKLHEATGHVATLGILNNDCGIYIDKIESSNFGLRLHSEIGKSFPLHCTAMGKVLLCHSDTELIRRICNRKLDAYTTETIVDSKVLRQELKKVKDKGYAVDREEITRGFVCVAAPIFNFERKVVGAMSCTFPSYVLQERGIDKEIEAVCRSAQEASSGKVSFREQSV